MLKHGAHLSHAQVLLTGIQGAPGTYIPRREIITGWLDSFMHRAKSSSYELGETEADDLVALEKFLRNQDVAIAARARS